MPRETPIQNLDAEPRLGTELVVFLFLLQRGVVSCALKRCLAPRKDGVLVDKRGETELRTHRTREEAIS